MRRRAHFTGVISKTSILYVQSRSGLLVKLRLLLEWPSSPYDKATIKQKPNTVKFPHHPPCTLPNLCFSLPPLSSLPQSKSLFCKTWSDEEKLYYACVGNKVKIALITKEANFFEISGRLKNRGKTTVFDW